MYHVLIGVYNVDAEDEDDAVRKAFEILNSGGEYKTFVNRDWIITDEDIVIMDSELRKFFEENFDDIQYAGCARCDLDKNKVYVFFKADKDMYKTMKEIVSKMQEREFNWLDVIIVMPYLGGD